MWARRLCGAICLTALTACTSGIAPTPPATLTLIPSTTTPIPTQIPASLTPDTSAIVPGTAFVAASPPGVATSRVDDQTLTSVDPIAAELVALAQRRIAADLGITMGRVRVDTVESVLWPDSSLGCPQPDQVYEIGEIDGYRIELHVGDDTYVFHTDFDRIVLCPLAREATPALNPSSP